MHLRSIRRARGCLYKYIMQFCYHCVFLPAHHVVHLKDNYQNHARLDSNSYQLFRYFIIF